MKTQLALLACTILFSCFAAEGFAKDPEGVQTLASIDLTGPFHTKTKWSFVVIQGPDRLFQRPKDAPPHQVTIDEIDELGALHFCFVQNDKRDCSDPGFNTLGSVDVVKPSETAKSPLLVVTASADVSAPASSWVYTMIWAYHPKSNTFDEIFHYRSFGICNEQTCIKTTAPLAGHIVIATGPTKAPYHYRITVYRLSKPDRYVEVLKFTGKTGSGDGNQIPVIDSEMPRILSRLHLWKPGDALPVPARMSQGCKTLELRDGTEWCIN
jgi:hypothetical protein